MLRGIPGKFLSTLLAGAIFVEILFFLQLINYNNAMTDIRIDAMNICDSVSDNRTLTEDQLADWNLALAGKGIILRGTIKRYVFVIEPGNTNSAMDTHTSKIPVDDITTWNQGDAVSITVEVVNDGAGGTIKPFMKNHGTFTYEKVVR